MLVVCVKLLSYMNLADYGSRDRQMSLNSSQFGLQIEYNNKIFLNHTHKITNIAEYNFDLLLEKRSHKKPLASKTHTV